jgi:hypothetical protein
MARSRSSSAFTRPNSAANLAGQNEFPVTTPVAFNPVA